MRGREFLLTLLLLCFASLDVTAAGPREAPKPTTLGQAVLGIDPRPVVAVHWNLLSVRLRKTPWEAVLQELERHTRIGIRVLGPFSGTLTQEFENLPYEQGRRRLFRNTNHMFFYTRDRTPGGAAETLTRIWLFPEAGGTEVGQETHSPPATPAAIEPQAGHRRLTQTARKRPGSSVMIPPAFDKLRLSSRETARGEPVEPSTGGEETSPRETAGTSADEQIIETSELDAEDE